MLPVVWLSLSLFSATAAAVEEGASGVFAEQAVMPEGQDVPASSDASGIWSSMLQDGRKIPVEFWGTFATISIIGIRNWDWGTSDFHTNSEGWFGYDTGSGGNDKMGHAFMTYGFTNNFSEALIHHGVPRARAARSAALLSQVLAMYVEVFDGYSADHGFSGEDVVFNLAGTGMAWLRQYYPAVHERFDYRMEYLPSGYKGFNPISDYAGMTWIFAWKLAGEDAFRDTPLRFFELQAGYYTRGFSSAERADGLRRTRNDFIGIGINLNEVFLGRRQPDENRVRRYARYLMEHYQVPYTNATHHRRI